jgi:hypothetical protein
MRVEDVQNDGLDSEEFEDEADDLEADNLEEDEDSAEFEEGDEESDENTSDDEDEDFRAELPTVTRRGRMSEEEREDFLARLAADPDGTLQEVIDQRVNERLSGMQAANAHLAAEAASAPELFRSLGPSVQRHLSRMDATAAASKPGVIMATLAALGEQAVQSGDLMGTLRKAVKLAERQQGKTPAAPPKKLPPGTQSPRPKVSSARATTSAARRDSSGKFVDDLAEMVGMQSSRTRRLMENEGIL